MSDGDTAILAVTLMLMLVGHGAIWMLWAADKRDERELEMLRRLLQRARRESDGGE